MRLADMMTYMFLDVVEDVPRTGWTLEQWATAANATASNASLAFRGKAPAAVWKSTMQKLISQAKAERVPGSTTMYRSTLNRGRVAGRYNVLEALQAADAKRNE